MHANQHILLSAGSGEMQRSASAAGLGVSVGAGAGDKTAKSVVNIVRQDKMEKVLLHQISTSFVVTAKLSLLVLFANELQFRARVVGQKVEDHG